MKDRIRYIPGPTRLLLVLLAFLACAGCSLVNHQPAAQPQPAIAILDAANTGNFGPRPALPTPEDIHRLDPEQIQHFLDYLHDPANAATSEHFRVGHYLQQITARFQYEGRTFDAASTLALKSGNCMSLAILTTALAEIAGLEIDYELMDDVPVFEFNETAIIKGVHIRSIIFDPAYSTDETRFTLTRPGVKIDYFPTNRQRFIGNMDRPVYLAMIYQNLSVEALENGDMDLAYWLAIT